MQADKAAILIRKDLKALGIGATVTTVKRLAVNISIEGVSADWLWENVDGTWKHTDQAKELLTTVWGVWGTPAYRLQCMIDEFPVYDYNGSCGFDYKIRTPELQDA